MTTMTFFTRAGPFDVSLRPDGTEGYGDLVRAAVRVEFHGQTVPVAALDDIIRSKNAAGRPKDQATLPELERYAADTKAEQAARLATEAYPEGIEAALTQETGRTAAQGGGAAPDGVRSLGDDDPGQRRGRSR